MAFTILWQVNKKRAFALFNQLSHYPRFIQCFKWNRRESNPRPKHLPSSFYKLSWSIDISSTIPGTSTVMISVAS